MEKAWHFRSKKRRVPLPFFRAEKFHLKPRPEIEGIFSINLRRSAAVIGIVRAGKACQGFTFDLICLVYLASSMNETVPPASSGERSSRDQGEGFWASGRRTKDDNAGDCAGIMPTGQKQSAPNQPGIFFTSFSMHRGNVWEPGYPHPKSQSLPRITINRLEKPSCDNREQSSSFKFDVNFDARSRRHSFNPLIALVKIALSYHRFFARFFAAISSCRLKRSVFC